MHDLPASDDPAGEEVYERRVDALRGHPNKGRETHNRPAPSPVPCENRRRRVSGHHEFARATAVKAVRGSRVTAGRALDPKELCSLFAVCDANRPDGTRNAAVLSLLYAAALRRSEVVALDRADFDSASGRLRVHGKGNKERTVYLSNGGLLAVRAWLQHRGDAPGPLIHPVRKGGTILPRRMDDQSVLDLVRRLALAANVQRFSPHDLRRTAVGDLLDSGVDLATAQKIAGHARHHLRYLLKEFVGHYLTERHHQRLGGQIIMPTTSPSNDNATPGAIGYRPRLGGLLNYYRREAA